MSGEPRYHLRIRRGDVGRYVLLPGDPGRVPLIAERLDRAEPVSSNREFVTYTGWLEDTRVSVTSTGIGGPSTAIAVEELIASGSDTFVRVGTAGGIGVGFSTADLVIATGAVRDDGTSAGYVPESYPAVADHDIVASLIEAAREIGVPFRRGIVRSSDAFFAEVAPETVPHHRHPMRIWESAGVVASEMECATLFVVASIRRARAGAVLGVINSSGEEIKPEAAGGDRLESLIRTAVEGLRRLIRLDATGATPESRKGNR